MRITRIYCPQTLAAGREIELGGAAVTHIVTVLRLKPGALLRIFNERDGEFEARLEEAGKTRARVRTLGACPSSVESPLDITLIQAISRGERMDFTIQKAVELGVARIVPVFSERSVVRLDGNRAGRRREHWQQIATAACEQCGRTRVPRVEMPVLLSQWLKGAPETDTSILLDATADTGIAELELRSPVVTLLVGAEGGWAPAERKQALHLGFKPLALGPRVLRTETAALVCLALLQYRWGDL